MQPAAVPAPLELRPVAGLANRLRAIASAACAAAELGRPLVVSWTQQHSILRGRPAQLFDLTATPFEIRDDEFGGPPPYPYRQILTAEEWERTAAAADPSKPIFVKSYGIFWQKDRAAWTDALRSIRPAQRIVDAVEETMGAGAAPVIGVHIRRTDNAKSIRESPTSAFVAAMEAHPPQTLFFVASDDEQERHTLAAAFPERIRTAATALTRDAEEGGQQAWIDFLCLSRCAEILGSAGSSFSEIAAAYGGCPLQVITPNA